MSEDIPPINCNTLGIRVGDRVTISSLPEGSGRYNGEYVVSRVEPRLVHLARLTWWRRVLRWLRRWGLDLGAP